MKKYLGTPLAPKKAYFGRTKAKVGCFSEKGLCYSIKILQGLLSNKNMRIPMKFFFRGLPLAPLKADFGRTKAEMGLCRNGFVLQF